ncbi:flagellar biosynthesis protein FlhF [Ideonella sp. 4Y16]|uniref:flagellar biosynthesis protein FlhF n=1 Tax=Ideonella alba TaxID=2824118 RepID=UPI001B39C750|nr:flagellar biosynthesis protein FlhF [Ideonella alba]MBQ0942003.1 flagellar biosynthesis protein FlhF [Ideonella alba]
MNVKRFTARTSREAFVLVRQAFGEDAVVLSTKPCSEGVEVLAMAPDAVDQIERVSGAAARKPAPARDGLAARAERQTAQRGLPGQRLVERQPGAAITQNEVDQDVEQLQMSTLSFQDYVRERMLRRRQAAIDGTPTDEAMEPMPAPAPAQRAPSASIAARASSPTRHETTAPIVVPQLSEALPERRDQVDMVHELRAMKGLIEERFGALAFMEKLQRHPQQATLAQTLLDCGWSPGLIRKLVEALPAQTGDATDWAARVLERNLATSEAEPALEEQGGIYALIGSTGVGKTTSTAKLAAAFATRYGASNLGLITLDAYRVGAQEQLRTYGRILGVPVHTAHDRASLEDLLELLAGKRMVLIDTAGIAQRDSRTKELLEMLSHPSIQRLLVVDASSQGETIDEVITAWRAARCKGVVLSKIDEAVKLAPALDAVIRHRLKVLAVANGQRVPEDWHRLSSNALVQRAMKATGAASWRLELPEVQLVFATAPRVAPTPSPL